jgi:hypothetical protein
MWRLLKRVRRRLVTRHPHLRVTCKIKHRIQVLIVSRRQLKSTVLQVAADVKQLTAMILYNANLIAMWDVREKGDEPESLQAKE